jgi:hypothetical protein
LILFRQYAKIDRGEHMANTAPRRTDINWVKASELLLVSEDSKLRPLEVNRLSTFFPNGLQRGSLVEITGSRSSGRTSTSLYILAESISRGETCAYIDLNNVFCPASLVQTGVTLDQLAWVRCNGNTEHAMRSADLLLHAGGFGVVLLDLSGALPQTLNRIPLSYWFRFQRAIEDTPTILLVCAEQLLARSCSRHSLAITARKFHWKGEAPFALLNVLESTAITNRPGGGTKVTSIRPESIWIQTGWIQTGLIQSGEV